MKEILQEKLGTRTTIIEFLAEFYVFIFHVLYSIGSTGAAHVSPIKSIPMILMSTTHNIQKI